MYPIFASFIIFVIFLSWSLHRHKNDDRLKTDKFFNKERVANASRKKSIEELDYIKLPAQLQISFEVVLSNADFTLKNKISSDDLDSLRQLYNHLESLSNKKILNLTGISNTELKLSYGVANLTPLSAYDQNYTSLVKILQSIASIYYKNNLPSIAKDFLEFSVETKSDVSSSYLLLSKIYLELGQPNNIETLMQSTQNIPGSQKIIIDRKLTEFCQSHDLLRS